MIYVICDTEPILRSFIMNTLKKNMAVWRILQPYDKLCLCKSPVQAFIVLAYCYKKGYTYTPPRLCIEYDRPIADSDINANFIKTFGETVFYDYVKHMTDYGGFRKLYSEFLYHSKRTMSRESKRTLSLLVKYMREHVSDVATLNEWVHRRSSYYTQKITEEIGSWPVVRI